MNLISVVITSYNDREIITPFHQAIIKTLENQNDFDWEIIYVDDGSQDGSQAVLEKIAADNPKITFIELSRNFGQQKAFFVGMKHSKGDIVVALDGDYQYEPQCILDLASKMQEGYDLVSGIRKNRKDTLFSKITSFFGNFFLRRILHYDVKDFGAVKAFNRYIIDLIIKHANYCIMPHGMAFALTNRIAEIKVEHRERHAGKSKWNLTKRLHMYFDLFLAYSSYESTSLIRVGGYLIAIGFITLSVLLYLFVMHDIFLFQTFRAALALLFIAGGIVLILSSFFISVLQRIYRQLLWQGSNYAIRNKV